jgi:hypothetical protein
MDAVASTLPQPLAPIEGEDLPQHILRIARMLARDCKSPGDYIVHLTIPDLPHDPVTVQTARMDVIRQATAKRK